MCDYLGRDAQRALGPGGCDTVSRRPDSAAGRFLRCAMISIGGMPPWSRSTSRQCLIFASSRGAWILEPSATELCEPDLHVFAKLFEDRLERGLEAQALSGREIGGDDDVLNFFVGHLVDVDLTR